HTLDTSRCYEKLIFNHQRTETLAVKGRLESDNHVGLDNLLIACRKERPFLNADAAAHRMPKMTAIVFVQSVFAHRCQHGGMHRTKSVARSDLLEASLKGLFKGLVDVARQRRRCAINERSCTVGGVSIDESSDIRFDQCTRHNDRFLVRQVRPYRNIVPMSA